MCFYPGTTAANAQHTHTHTPRGAAGPSPGNWKVLDHEVTLEGLCFSKKRPFFFFWLNLQLVLVQSPRKNADPYLPYRHGTTWSDPDALCKRHPPKSLLCKCKALIAKNPQQIGDTTEKTTDELTMVSKPGQQPFAGPVWGLAPCAPTPNIPAGALQREKAASCR